MKQISHWAYHHKVATRTIFVILYLGINVAGILIGDMLYLLHVELPTSFFSLAVLLTLIGVIIYPSVTRKRSYQNFYARQKFADALLLMATLFFIVFAGNSWNTYRKSVYTSAYGISLLKNSKTADSKAQSSIDSKENERTVSKKSLRKSIVNSYKELRKKYEEANKTQKTIAIILIVLLAIILTYFMVGLACGISCSGSEALAIVVGIVGVGAIVFGAVKWIQHVTRRKRKSKEVPSSALE